MSKERPSREELNRLYNQEKWTQTKLAKHYQVSRDTVLRWLQQERTIIRSRSQVTRLRYNKIIPSKNKLTDLYWDDALSTRKIAKIYGVNPATVYTWMKEYGIERRDHLKARRLRYDKKKPSKEKLDEMYHKKGMSPSKIGNMLNIDTKTVYRWMDQDEIKRKKNKRTIKSGSWKDLEFTLQQAKAFLEEHPEYKEIPEIGMLRNQGYNCLGFAISKYHGGFPAFRAKLAAYMAGEPIPENPSEQPSLLEQYIGGENG